MLFWFPFIFGISMTTLMVTVQWRTIKRDKWWWCLFLVFINSDSKKNAFFHLTLQYHLKSDFTAITVSRTAIIPSFGIGWGLKLPFNASTVSLLKILQQQTPKKTKTYTKPSGTVHLPNNKQFSQSSSFTVYLHWFTTIPTKLPDGQMPFLLCTKCKAKQSQQ